MVKSNISCLDLTTKQGVSIYLLGQLNRIDLCMYTK